MAGSLAANARKRKREAAGASSSSAAKWRSRREHDSYSNKLLDALRRVRAGGAPVRGPAVREAADRALAVAARGRTLWSRAVLAAGAAGGATRLRLRAKKPRRVAVPSRTSSAAETKARVLGRLVPGCKKLPFPALLDEVTDYIAALEMQVQAMSALAQAVAAVSGATATEESSATALAGDDPPTTTQ